MNIAFVDLGINGSELNLHIQFMLCLVFHPGYIKFYSESFAMLAFAIFVDLGNCMVV